MTAGRTMHGYGGGARPALGLWLVLGILMLAAGPARAISVPDCGRLEALAGALDAERRVPLNQWSTVSSRSTGNTLTEAVASPAFADAFGAPLLDWSREDLRTFAVGVSECMKAASREKRFDAQKALIELRRVVQFHHGQPGNSVRRAREQFDAQIEALEALPDGPDKLALFGLVSGLRNADPDGAVSDVRIPLDRTRAEGATAARQLALAVMSLPQPEADAHLDRIVAARDRLVAAVLAGLTERLDEAGGDVAGLAAIERVLAETRGELARHATPADLDEVRAAAESARSRVWGALEQAIAALPVSADGVARLDAMRSSPDYRALRPEDRRRLDEIAAERRQQVAEASIRAPIERLAGFPRTVDGVRNLVAYARETRAKLGRSLTRDARQAFENAYAEVHPAALDAIQGEVERLIGAVPESPEGARQITTLLEDLDAPARSAVYRAGLERSRQIALAVERDKRRARCDAALPDLDLDEDDAAQPVMGLGGSQPRLGDLLCDIALAGNRVHGYEGPGFFDDDHRLEITARDGIFRTYTLNPAPVGPDEEALVGVVEADPTRERPLAVDDWLHVLAGLLPDSAAARDARCRRLMNTPEAELSASDRMAAVDCVMKSLVGPG